MIKNKKYILISAALVFSFLLPDFAGASSLTQAGVRLGRLGISATSGNDVLVTFKLNTTPTSVSKIKVTFPSGFTVTTGTPAVGTTGFTNTPASITAPPGSLTSAATAGSKDIVVSGLTSGSLDNTTLYGFTIPTGTVQNPGSAGQYNVTVESENSGGTAIDTTTTPVYVYGAGANGDQLTVHASVSPNFSFSLSANSDTVPQVDPTTIQTSTGVNMVVGTNSPLGYTAYVKSSNGSLTSAISSGTPITSGTFNGSPDTVTAGASKYGFVPTTGAACSTCNGTLTYDTEYSAGAGAPISSGTQAGSFNSTSFASFVSRSGYTNADTIALKERVAVANTVGYANDYTDTLTIVAAGNF
jgi:hypothetical protein